jgi:predicted helicase
LRELVIIMDHRKTISSSNNWIDLKAKIDACSKTKDKGDIFELLTKLYLQIVPRYVSKLKTTWLFNEIPINTLKKLNLPTKDMGIDLVAETNEGEYWAIQSKYKADESKSLTWREI